MIADGSGPAKCQVSIRTLISVSSSGGAIFSGWLENGSSLRVIAAGKVLPRVPAVGEVWHIDGEFQRHSAYGIQLHVKSGRPQVPRGRLIQRYLRDHPDFSGIGKGKAEALWNHFGERLASVISAGDLDSLEQVLAKGAAENLIAAWSRRIVEAELIEHLDRHGVDWRATSQLLRVWGAAARSMLDSNPYLLLAFVNWRSADNVAKKLGVESGDERRLVGAVEAAVYGRLEEAHTLTTHPLLLELVGKLLTHESAAHAIALARKEEAIAGDEIRGYQPIGAAALERGVERRLNSMLSGEVAAQRSLQLMSIEADAGGVIAAVEAQQGFRFNPEQRAAVLLPFEGALAVLTGGAGVGKTTVLRAIVELANRQAMTVFQMALAGRAAQRMVAATGAPASTIARFIGAARTGQVEVPANSLVVIDEASMLDLPTLYRVLKYLPDGVRLLLVGDAAQLPPISFGLVFHRLVDSVRVPKVHLTEIHRHALSTGLPTAALSVLSHKQPEFVPYGGLRSGVSFIDSSADDVMVHLRRISRDWQNDEFQVLSAVNIGKAGIRHINQSFHFDACEADVGLPPFVVGEPVIHLVNDYERGLMNGSLGRVVNILTDGQCAVQFDEEIHLFQPNRVRDEIELAYAISVHKAQCSQFKRVVVVVGKSRLLDHALIYTALTRAVEQVVFVGDRGAFELAIYSEPLVSQRSVAFAL